MCQVPVIIPEFIALNYKMCPYLRNIKTFTEIEKFKSEINKLLNDSNHYKSRLEIVSF